MTLHAQIIQEEGRPKFAVIPYEEFKTLQQTLESFDELEDFVDYMHAQRVKQETTVWHTISDVKKELGL